MTLPGFHTPYGVTSFRTVTRSSGSRWLVSFPYALWRDFVSDQGRGYRASADRQEFPYALWRDFVSDGSYILPQVLIAWFPYALWRDFVSDWEDHEDMMFVLGAVSIRLVA